MAIKELTTRIQLKYDSYENWTKTTVAGEGANLVLKAGEIGICHISAAQAEAAGLATNESAVLFKVGDGVHTYSELEWCSGPATDVYNWAKAENKPTYSADEILNLSSYISNIAQDTIPSEVTSSIETHGMGWTVSAMGEVVVEETEYTSDASGKICTTGLDIETPCVAYPNPGQMLCVCNGVECDVEVGYGHNDEYDENFYSMNITHNGEQVLYLWQLEGSFYVINGNTTQPNQTVDFIIYSVDNEVNQIAEKYMPDKVTKAIETGGMGWTDEEEVPAISITWDGDTEGRESFDGGDIFCYKVSDEKLTISELIGSVITVNRTAEQYTISNLDRVESPSPDVVIAAITFDNADYIIYSGTLSETTDGGTYFSRGSVGSFAWYISSLTKEASIQETVHQIDEKYIPSSGSSELPPEVTNAIETGGLGWTSEEEITEITWDGVVDDAGALLMDEGHLAAEVNIDVNGLIGKSVTIVSNGEETTHTITSVSEIGGTETIIAVYADDRVVTIYLSEDIYDVTTFKAGIYLPTFDTNMHDGQQNSYVSALEIPSITQETVHQIDDKYLPEVGGRFVVKIEDIEAQPIVADKTLAEITAAYNSGKTVELWLGMGGDTDTERYILKLAELEDNRMAIFQADYTDTHYDVFVNHIDNVDEWGYQVKYLPDENDVEAWYGKQDAIADLAAIRSGAALGATAVQPEAGKGLFSGSYNDLSNKPTIPSTADDISYVASADYELGTVGRALKILNTSVDQKYNKPSGGIPKTDLASNVQASLEKADTALQHASDVETALINDVNLIWGTSWNGGDVVDALYYAKNSLQSVPDTYRTAAAQDTIDNTKQDKLSFEGTYNASTNKVVTKSYVDDIVGDILNRLTNI